MPSKRGAIFGQMLGQGIERGAESISQAIKQRYLNEAKKAQDKADRAWETTKYLMGEGLEPEVSEYVTGPEYKKAQATGGAVKSDLIQKFEEWRTGKKEEQTLDVEHKKAQIEALKDRPAGLRGGVTTQTMKKEVSDAIYRALDTDPEGQPVLTYGEADRLTRIKNMDLTTIFKALNVESDWAAGKEQKVQAKEMRTAVQNRKERTQVTPQPNSLGKVRMVKDGRIFMIPIKDVPEALKQGAKEVK